MKNLKYFPFMVLPIIYGIYLLCNISDIKTIDDAIQKGLALMWVILATIIIALVQLALIEIWYRKHTNGYIAYLDYLGRTNKHIAEMKNKRYMEHAKDWGIKDMEAPHYTN